MTLNPYMVNDMGSFHLVPIVNGSVVNWMVIGGATDVEQTPAAGFVAWNNVAQYSNQYFTGTTLTSNFFVPQATGRHLLDIGWNHKLNTSTSSLFTFVNIQTYASNQTSLLTTTSFQVPGPDGNGNTHREHTSMPFTLDTDRAYRIVVSCTRGFGVAASADNLEGTDTWGITYIK